MALSICTTEADVEAGYADYEHTITTMEELSEAAQRAGQYGVPAHRLTVTAYYDTVTGRQHDILGSLEEVLYTQRNERNKTK